MKIKTVEKSYEEVLALRHESHWLPRRPGFFFRTLMRVASAKDLKAVHFTYQTKDMEKLGKQEPCLYLMNHSSFNDLKIASRLLYPRPYNIVCTSDGFVGKKWLMHRLGCIATKKFVPELGLVRDMMFSLKKLNCSVLMYPEASYSFDGTATPLPDSLGRCIKMLGVPVVMIRTYGAFSRDPLYNGLQLRQVDVRAEMEYLLSPSDIKEKKPEEINALLRDRFTFDHFRWQTENGVEIAEPFRADYLNRVLYRCPACGTEGKTEGRGTEIVCHACGKKYELTTLGELRAADGVTEFPHVPDWYAWERECVRREIEDGTYSLDIPVRIGMMVNTDAIYMVGKGRLTHSAEGFHLTGCDGRLEYRQKPIASYSLYADYYWYEIGDMVCIGNHDVLYYCFPEDGGDIVAKTRIATEELYRLARTRTETASKTD